MAKKTTRALQVILFTYDVNHTDYSQAGLNDLLSKVNLWLATNNIDSAVVRHDVCYYKLSNGMPCIRHDVLVTYPAS